MESVNCIHFPEPRACNATLSTQEMFVLTTRIQTFQLMPSDVHFLTFIANAVSSERLGRRQSSTRSSMCVSTGGDRQWSLSMLEFICNDTLEHDDERVVE